MMSPLLVWSQRRICLFSFINKNIFLNGQIISIHVNVQTDLVCNFISNFSVVCLVVFKFYFIFLKAVFAWLVSGSLY